LSLPKDISSSFLKESWLGILATNIEKNQDTRKKSIIICIPAYNEEKTIAKVIVDAKKHSDNIIVIDDGSSDYTPHIVKQLGVKLLQHKKNLGKGAALRTGFTYAMTFHPDVVVTMDGDCQHDPSFIPDLIEPIIKEEADLVIGSRSTNTKMPSYRKLGFNVISFLNRKATHSNIKDHQSGFRAYSKKSFNAIAKETFQDYSVESEQLELLIKNGFEIKEVPIEIKYHGLHNTSKKNFLTHGGELILASLFMIIARRPIMYLALPGSIFLLVGFFFAFYTLILFNMDRYFSLPMSILSVGLLILGSLFCFSSMFIYIISKMQMSSRYR